MDSSFDMAYVQVSEEGSAPVELPTEDDNTLLLSTLTAQFPRATGLKYQFEETGCIRGIRLTDGRLFPPADGWNDRVYRIVLSNTKRKGEDEEQEYSNIPKSKRLEVKKCTDLIVLNLPWHVDEAAMKTYFSRYGEVAMTQIKRDPNTSKSRGYGFIRFREYAAQTLCLSERHFIESRWCDVRIPISKSEGDRQDVSRKLHIGQLTEDITADMLRDHFSQFGMITDVFVPRPFRAFAFITFDDSDVAAALLGRDQIVNGKTLTVGSAVPKMSMFQHNPSHYQQNMVHHNVYQNQPNVPWGAWQQFGAFGYGDGNGNAQNRGRYAPQPMTAQGMNQAAMSTAAVLASQYTRAHQTQNSGYTRQRPGVNYQCGGGDNAALATLNILSNPSVVAAIVNAAKGDGLATGNGMRTE